MKWYLVNICLKAHQPSVTVQPVSAGVNHSTGFSLSRFFLMHIRVLFCLFFFWTLPLPRMFAFPCRLSLDPPPVAHTCVYRVWQGIGLTFNQRCCGKWQSSEEQGAAAGAAAAILAAQDTSFRLHLSHGEVDLTINWHFYQTGCESCCWFYSHSHSSCCFSV